MSSPTETMAEPPKKPIARSLGEFFGHIIRAVKTKPQEPGKTTVRKTVQEDDRGDVVLRRTTVEEVEIKRPDKTDP